MSTSLFEGRVYHARTKCVSSPVDHSFAYPVWMALIDLEQVEDKPETLPSSLLCTFAQTDSAWPALTRWKRSDHFGGKQKLSDDVKTLVKERTGIVVDKVELLTNLSFFGVYNFNPVSVYYCYVGARLSAAVLEVSNTPWLDKRLYVLQFNTGVKENGYRFCWEKDFHVSPFMDVSHYYDWILKPLEEDGARLAIEAISKRKALEESVVPWAGAHVNGGEPVVKVLREDIELLPTSFVVKLNMKRVPWSKAWRTILGNPIMPLAAVWWIHVEAFRVWYKGVQYITPPARSRLLDAKDGLIHLVVFAFTIFIRYGVLLPIRLVRRLILALNKRLGLVSRLEDPAWE